MSVYYETKTLIDTVTMGLSRPLQPTGNSGFYNTITAASAGYGSDILPLSPYTPPTGLTIDIEEGFFFARQLYGLGTPDPLWIPNIQTNEYTQQSYARAYFDYNPNQPAAYYLGTNGFGDPVGNPVFFSGMERVSRGVQIFYKKRYLITSVTFGSEYKPNYVDLRNGYSLDSRTKPLQTPIISPITATINIGYYRQNKLESIPELKSIDWMTYTIDVVENQLVYLPIIDPVFGTVVISNQLIKDAISSIADVPNKYPYSFYFEDNLDALFSHWLGLWNAYEATASAIPSNASESATLTEISRTLRCLAANNNHWNNRPTPTADLNFDRFQSMFTVDNNRAYKWHIKPQPNGSYGDLIMDSPRTIEIHKALNAGKYAINELDNTKQRVTDLGFLVERIAKVLGIRLDANGKIDILEEKKIVRKVIDSKYKIDDKKIGVNCFGDEGIVVKRINNRFKNKDEIVSDQCVIVHDLLQLIQEYHEQHNLAVGLQESSAIEIKDGKDKEGKSKARFDNQLGLLVEIFNLLSSANEMTRAALISSLVTQSQTSEVIAGLGLPSVTKTIPIEIDKKVTQLPYKGIAPHRSISQEVATCTANVGIVLGQLI